MKFLGETSLTKLISLIKSEILLKQDKISSKGVLKGDGTGTISSIAVATFTEIGDIDDIVTVQSADEVSY